MRGEGEEAVAAPDTQSALSPLVCAFGERKDSLPTGRPSHTPSRSAVPPLVKQKRPKRCKRSSDRKVVVPRIAVPARSHRQRSADHKRHAFILTFFYGLTDESVYDV